MLTMKLRPYCRQDAEKILSWITDEYMFRQWSADRYEHYPIMPAEMNKYYECFAGADRFYPVTAFDEHGIMGHLILRFTDDIKETIRFGFVIIDPKLRGQGKGREMLLLAKQYAFEVLGAKVITLGVFENNPSALHCYLSAGFHENKKVSSESINIGGERWKCIELCCSAAEQTGHRAVGLNESRNLSP